ncbi:hypothetical protein U1Q18_039249 [Sarracenia purpurea var. burkii]
MYTKTRNNSYANDIDPQTIKTITSEINLTLERKTIESVGFCFLALRLLINRPVEGSEHEPIKEFQATEIAPSITEVRYPAQRRSGTYPDGAPPQPWPRHRMDRQ